ncbi:hypothetical protein J3R30DRAFT_676386 [Lentinula aciculospora]|uniref:Uncharacterized protein n=1 Tax=Lentinula aciculospora TaxID=153920 RepID=A0A9W9A788_9AGAR|nr:hypothetical protein J3R30DRAFT_676386 [Lentinula aciculospora]
MKGFRLLSSGNPGSEICCGTALVDVPVSIFLLGVYTIHQLLHLPSVVAILFCCITFISRSVLLFLLSLPYFLFRRTPPFIHIFPHINEISPNFPTLVFFP